VSQVKRLRYPWLRDQVRTIVAHLADPIYQSEAWVSHEPGSDAAVPYEDFRDVVDRLDDLGFFTDPARNVGIFLVSDGEAVALSRVAGALDDVLRECGRDAEVWAQLESDAWPRVIDRAREAMLEMDKNEGCVPIAQCVEIQFDDAARERRPPLAQYWRVIDTIGDSGLDEGWILEPRSRTINEEPLRMAVFSRTRSASLRSTFKVCTSADTECCSRPRGCRSSPISQRRLASESSTCISFVTQVR